jgi:hypothetical protein
MPMPPRLARAEPNVCCAPLGVEISERRFTRARRVKRTTRPHEMANADARPGASPGSSAVSRVQGTSRYLPCSSAARIVWNSVNFSESAASLSASRMYASQCTRIFLTHGFSIPVLPSVGTATCFLYVASI